MFHLVRYYPTMSTAPVQQFGQNLASWLAIAEHGETVAIMDKGRIVARLTPPEKTEASPASSATPLVWPDFAARQSALFGDRIVWTEEESRAHWEHERGV